MARPGRSWSRSDGLHDLAHEIIRNTPAGAARTTARLFKAVLDLLSARQLAEFKGTLAAEIAKLGYRLAYDPPWVPFASLQIGDEFAGPQGRCCRKMEVVVVNDFREGFALRLEAMDVANRRPVYILSSQEVRKLESETPSAQAGLSSDPLQVGERWRLHRGGAREASGFRAHRAGCRRARARRFASPAAK